MFRNYLNVTIRNIRKNWLSILFNIVGLSLAVAISITAFLNNKYDSDWDKFHENLDEIYKISIFKENDDRLQDYGVTPMILGDVLKEDVAGIDHVVRYQGSYSPIKYEDQVFNKRVAYADEDFLDVFTIKLLKGNKADFRQKGNVIISDELAEILFGDAEPLGKLINIFNDKDEETSFVVAGVFKGLPLNSSLQFEALVLLDNFIHMWEIDESNWKTWTSATFLHVKNPSSLPVIEEKLKSYVPVQNKAREDWKIHSFFVEPMSIIDDTAFNRWSNGLWTSFHPAAVMAPPIMAIFILLIAAFNFTNTSIAFAGKRLKEIGVRKVVGGHRKHIIIQFLLENLVLSFISLIIGVFIAGFLVPEYSAMWEYLNLNNAFYTEKTFWIFALILLFGTALLAGSYPAFYVSSFNPVNIFRDKLKLGGRSLFTKILLTFQFMISMVALVSGVGFTQNAYFQDRLDLGYDKENVVLIPLHNQSDFEPLRNALQSNPKIEAIAGTEEHIGWGNYRREVNYLENKQEVSLLDIGIDYAETMGLRLTEGRFFNKELKGSDIENNSIVVSQKFVDDFKIEKPIGKRLYMNDTVPLNIIGVVKNVYLYGSWSDVEPLVFKLGADERMRNIVIRSSADNRGAINDFARSQWSELVPNYPYEGRFQEDLLEEAREINNNIKIMYVFLAVNALFLSALGLYTLVSLSVLSRVKEIGVRKVLGSSIPQIMRVINMPYAIILIISTAVGSVAGWYATTVLMDSIWETYTNLNFWSFALPTIVMFVTAIVTISGRVYKAANQNPAHSLRYE